MMHSHVGDMLKLVWWAVIGLFRARASLEAEILTLRHQLNVLQRKSPKRFTFSNFDRLVFATLYRFAPRIVNALAIVEPETVIRWHRAGFRLVWRPDPLGDVRRSRRLDDDPVQLPGADRLACMLAWKQPALGVSSTVLFSTFLLPANQSSAAEHFPVDSRSMSEHCISR